MDLLRLGQLYNGTDLLKEQKVDLAKKINISYSVVNNTCKNLQNKSYLGYNCLHIAALKLDFDFIHELVNRGADLLKQGTRNGKTSLHVAIDVKKNCKEKRLWEISGKLQDCQIVNTLLLAHIRRNNPFNPRCKDGISHLHIACMFNCLEAVRFFLKNGEAIDQVTNADAHWPLYTPLHFAVRYSSVETAGFLLNTGADLFAKDTKGTSPLHLLISRTLNVADYITMGQRTIFIPYEEELQRIETILSIVMKMKSGNGANFLDDTGLTTFHVACTLRDPSVAASFLNDNVDLNLPVKSDSKHWPGWTPLHFAASSSAETVKLLVQEGADIAVKNARGETPLDMCLKRYSPRVVHSILSTKDDFKTILLLHTPTTLLDLMLAMNDTASFHDYLGNLDRFDICVSPTSPLLPGYSLLHLALSMNERTKSWDDFLRDTDSREAVDLLPQVYSCTEDESRVFAERVRACLTVGRTVDVKNRDDSTPIHLAFKTRLLTFNVLEELFNHCEEDVVGPDGLSHLHIACAVGDQVAVQKLLNAGANVDAVAPRFQWYRRPYGSSGNVRPYLIRVNANSTPLHVAVAFEHAVIVQILVDSGADVYATDSEGFTPVHLSIAHSSGSNRIAKIIVNRPGELVDLVSREGLSHLHVAAFAGDADAIEKLVRNGANVDGLVDLTVPHFLSRFAGKAPLRIATRGDGAAQAVKALIELGADIYINDVLQCLMGKVDFDFNQYFVNILKYNEHVSGPIDSSGLTLLHVACSRFDVDWATELLNKGADVNARIRYDYEGQWKGYTPLHALVFRKYAGDNSKVNAANTLGAVLLIRGADVTIDSVDGTPLHASGCGHMRKKQADRPALRLRQDLGQARAQVQQWRLVPVVTVPNNRLALRIQQPQVVMVRHNPELPAHGRPPPDLLQWPPYRQGRDPRAVANFHRPRPAVQHGPPSDDAHEKDDLSMEMLHAHRSYEINPISPDGFSHFHFFCIHGNAMVVKEFLDNGVDIDHSTNPFIDCFAGYTALHFALKYQAFHVANLLIEHGANVNAENADGNTPLHLMVLQDLIDTQRTVILLLKRYGANFNAANLQGETPADVLMTKRNFSLEQLRFLLSNGSTINIRKSSSLPGPAALIMRNVSWNSRMEMFKLFIDVCDIRAAAKSGYNPIQDIVKVRNNAFYMLTADVYSNVMMEFINVDCDVDQVDEKGFTPLHNSIVLDNPEAVYALLQVGADMNACNIDSQIFESGRKNRIEEHLAFHVHKMKMFDFYVNHSSNAMYHQYRRKIGGMDENMETYVAMEFEKAESIKFTRTLTARAFLSESWGVVYYSKLPPAHRQTVDVFFRNIDNLLKEFPLLCGLMILQYKKALVRPELIETAKEVLASECEIDLPDLCLECILSFFSCDQVKYLIEHSGETQNHFKRQRVN